MKIGRSFIFLCLIFVIAAIPGCGGRKKLTTANPLNTKLQTSIDVPSEFDNEKLSRMGLSSQEGEILAQNQEQKEESAPVTIAEKVLPTDQLPPCPEEEPSIEFHFENADLEMLINQVSELFDVTFVADDSIMPMLQGAKSVRGNKISFKTQRPLTRKDAWDLFITFLDIAGFAVSAGPACSSGRVAASSVLLAMGVAEELAATAIRVSWGWNTTKADIEAFASAWKAMYLRIARKAA